MNIDTAAQSRAITTKHPQILCVAGPGSGKTTVLTKRIVRLIEDGIEPHRICAFTYTNAAARNLDERLAKSGACDCFGPITIRLGFTGTLHGFCLRMLKQYGGDCGYGERTAVIDDDSSQELLAVKAKQMGCKTPVKKLLEHKRQGSSNRKSKTLMLLDDEELVVLAYKEELRESGLLDFDMILTEFYSLLSTQERFANDIGERFDFLFDDECQDHALIDWKILRNLPMKNKFFVGDPDQAIFGFRGGEPKLMRLLADDPGTSVIMLEDNFRCAREICAAANTLIAHNANRLEKWTDGKEFGGIVQPFGQTVNEGDEIAQVLGYMKHLDFAPTETAILARSNAIAAGFRDALKAAGVPVTEPPRVELPADWQLARAIIEMMANPSNDTLAFFYCIAHALGKGATPLDARKAAHDIRSNAHSKGTRINAGWAGATPTISDVPQALDRDKVSTEARIRIGEIILSLPSGSTILDLALEVARENPEPIQPAVTGVTVTTIHSAKGREWDAVFLVGFEDEVIPGSAKSTDVEEERRLAFVGLTRARKAVYLSHAASRRATWGPKPIETHNPSRFLKEMKS